MKYSIWLSLTIMICHWLTTSQTFLQTPIPAVGSLMLINPLIPNADFSILTNRPSKWTLNRSGHLINAMTAHLMNDQWWSMSQDSSLLWLAARSIFGALYWKTELGTCSCHVASAKKTEIAQIRLPWGFLHDFSLQLDFSGFPMIFSREGSRTYRRKGAQSPPDPPMKEHHWAVAVWMELVFPQTCYWLCAASKTVARRRQNIWPGNLFKVEVAKLLQNSDQSISITRTTYTSLSGHVVRYGNT